MLLLQAEIQAFKLQPIQRAVIFEHEIPADVGAAIRVGGIESRRCNQMHFMLPIETIRPFTTRYNFLKLPVFVTPMPNQTGGSVPF